MVIYYAEKDPDAWKTTPTWDDTPIMCKSFEPTSFVLNRPLRRPEPDGEQNPDTQPEPMSLPPAKYIPPPPHKLRGKYKNLEVWDESILRIDGIPYMEIDGDLVEVQYERHSGPINKFPRPHPVPGLNKKPRGRKAPLMGSKERKGTTYPCRICLRAFSRPDHMKRHVRSVHMHMENTYICSLPFCTKSFSRRDNLLQHERKHKLYGAIHDCTKNFEGELFPGYLPHDAEPAILEAARNFVPPWLSEESQVPDIPESAAQYGGGEDLCDEDWKHKGDRYRVMREDKFLAEALAAEKAEAEDRKAALRREFAPPPAIGTSRNIPLRLHPIFPADFYYGGVVPS